MSKFTFTLICALLPTLASAGVGGGGTGPRPSLEAFSSIQPKILFSLGQEDNIFKFAHGTYVNNKWEIQDVEVLASDLKDHPDVIEAFEKSQVENDWTPIK